MRKRMTKESKIVRALRKGYHPKAVAAYYNTSLNYVYKVRMHDVRSRDSGPAPSVNPDQGSAPEPARVPTELVGPPLPAGLVTLQPEIPQPTAGIGPLPSGSGEVVVKKPEPPELTRWQRFKLWAWGKA